MKKTKTSFITNIAVVLFLASEAIIYYLIHVSKISSPISLRYLSIQISALFSWIFIALNLVKKEKGALTRATSGYLLGLGLILFALCDINVGLAVLNDLYGGSFSEGSIIHSILYSGVDLAWIFYLPSQAVIPLTILSSKRNKS